MKKVLKLSSLLAAVLLLTVLAGVQLITAQTTDVDFNEDYVSNMANDRAANEVMVTVTADLGGAVDASVTVMNKATKEEKDVIATGGAGTYTVTIIVRDSTTTVEAITNMDEKDRSIAASDGDVIEVSFQREGSRIKHVDEVTVDAKGPTIDVTSPAHKTRTNVVTLRLAATVTDSGAGLGADAGDVDATFSIGGEELAAAATKPADGSSTVSRFISVGEGAFEWRVTARDALGNEGRSDAVPDDNDDMTTADAGYQDHEVVVDGVGPSIASAETGVVLDTSGDDPMEKMTGSRTAIVVRFLDGGLQDVEDSDGAGLNGTTVQDSDFRVDVGGQAQSIASVVFNDGLPKHVFITLADDLAGDDQPRVRLVGQVEDTAGNATGTGEQDASDGIAPMLTVSLDGSAGNVTNDKLIVLVGADEKSRNPSRTTGITVSKITKGTGDNADADIVGAAAGFSAARFRTVTSGEQWEWTFNLANAANGTYNVCVEVNDTSGSTGNTGTKGTCAAATGETLIGDSSITFTVDTMVPDPTVIPEKTDNTGAFVEIMYGEKITTLTVTIAGDAVDTSTLDDKTFAVAPPADGYPVGKHEVAVTATDVAGNTKTVKETIEIVARAAFKLNLRPGYNLISLPGTPESTAINDVIGADHSINQVLAYSPFVEGGWLSAERGDDGAFAGTLTDIDGSTAYIVRTTSFEPLSVMIPRMPLGNVLPPQTNLGVGWNLVPVIDLSSDLANGATIEGYFQGVGDAILTIDDSGRLTAIASDDGVVGKGYWVYATRAAVLLPTRR